MEVKNLFVFGVVVVVMGFFGGVELKVLDLTHAPDLTTLNPSQQRQLSPRSVNLSFFVPAFSLFALASQFMPQMFPSLTTTTSSKKSLIRSRRSPSELPNLHEFIQSGVVY